MSSKYKYVSEGDEVSAVVTITADDEDAAYEVLGDTVRAPEDFTMEEATPVEETEEKEEN